MFGSRMIAILVVMNLFVPRVEASHGLLDVNYQTPTRAYGGNEEGPYYAVVDSDKVQTHLSIRNGPDGSVIGRLAPGESVTVMGRVGSWATINYQGENAFVWAFYLKRAGGRGDRSGYSPYAPDSTARSTGSFRPTGRTQQARTYLDVYDRPGGAVVGHVSPGDSIKVTGRDGRWAVIEYQGEPVWQALGIKAYKGGAIGYVRIRQAQS